MTERWADIPGYEGYYQVSDQGRVKSMDRFVIQHSRKGSPMLRKTKGTILSPVDNGSGYLMVILHKSGERDKRYIHRLVAEAFLDNERKAPEVNHIDYDRHNNGALNLEWVTKQENVHHSLPHMRGPKKASRPGRTGHKYITTRDGKYRLVIVVNDIRHDRMYQTLEDALAIREAITGGWQHFAR